MANMANGTFDIVMTSGPPEVGGAVGRFDFTKTFHGDLEAMRSSTNSEPRASHAVTGSAIGMGS